MQYGIRDMQYAICYMDYGIRNMQIRAAEDAMYALCGAYNDCHEMRTICQE